MSANNSVQGDESRAVFATPAVGPSSPSTPVRKLAPPSVAATGTAASSTPTTPVTPSRGGRIAKPANGLTLEDLLNSPSPALKTGTFSAKSTTPKTTEK